MTSSSRVETVLPADSPKTRPALKNVLREAAVFAFLFVIFISLAWKCGTFQNELTGEADEPSHYATAVLVRDYVAGGLRQGPMAFGNDFYLHYPKAALGHWPPAFYVMQAAWMLGFGDSPTASLLLLFVMTAGLGFLLYRTVRRQFSSEIAGIAAGALFMFLPVIQMYGRMIMADLPVALFSFAALLAWSEFMVQGSRGRGLLYGILTATAILTKGNGYALVLVPPLSIVICRQWKLLRNRYLWLAAACVGVLTVPWNLLTLNFVVPAMQQNSFSIPFFLQRGIYFLGELVSSPGIGLAVFAGIGLIVKVIVPLWRSSVEPLWGSAAAFLIANQLLHTLIPMSIDPRYLLASFPVFILFLAAGIHWSAVQVSRKFPLRYAAVGISLVLGIAFFLTVFSIPVKVSYGFDEVAEELLKSPGHPGPFLCSSLIGGEGVFIAEILRRERHRPDHIVTRATQLLASMGWNGENYQLLVHNPQEVAQILDGIAVDAVVIERTTEESGMPHQMLLLQAVQSDPNWQLTGVYPRVRKSNTAPNARIELYQWKGAPRTPTMKLNVNIQRTPKIAVVPTT